MTEQVDDRSRIMARTAELKRTTKETDIFMKLDLDGKGRMSGDNPVPFFEHMMSHLVRYSMIDLELKLKGDLEIDCHHSVEDTAIVLGECLREALGDKKGIFRYGHFTLPMDDVLTTVAVDLSGRPYFKYSGPELKGSFNIYDAELTPEFLHKLSIHGMMNLHVQVHYGHNRHHIHESIFKALGMSLRQAVSSDERREDVPSTKGSL